MRRWHLSARAQIKSDDLVIDLRDADEADLITADAQRLGIDQITADLPLKRRWTCCPLLSVWPTCMGSGRKTFLDSGLDPFH